MQLTEIDILLGSGNFFGELCCSSGKSDAASLLSS